ncbi:2,3-bisphosphoglycerate-dependent phosphoglycerate mutase [bioreactor metagenome]|uniref:phosphoglycerate mutase (2,3-diphosphoglycerate-dependent) n=1 Tax=bioreactor metagenome TaxID=1076179 RepID=A0A644YF55_9ZZZZ
MGKLIVVRHGETAFNVEGRYTGRVDVSLNIKGLEQARVTAAKLKDMSIDIIISSTLKRAKETAEIISRELQVPVIEMEEFVEKYVGVYEGLTREEAKTKYPQMWEANAPEGAETLEEVKERVYKGLNTIQCKYLHNKNVLLVTHGYVSKVINRYFDNSTNEEFAKYVLRNCDYHEYSICVKENIFKELEALGLKSKEYITLDEIRNKDGIYLYRVKYKDENFVLKYFLNHDYKREISNYSLLKRLEVPTIKVLSTTDNSLLLEDIDKSYEYRLGREEDLSDPEVARAIAKWYKKLHEKGLERPIKDNERFYREIDCITKENLLVVKNKSNTKNNSLWNLIEDNWNLFLSTIKGLEETLNYNDFYWTNLVVSKDKKEALMFDYNFLGIGSRYNDIRNVTVSLSEVAKNAFMDEYGGFSQKEKVIDGVTSPLITLISAYKKDTFPKWAEEAQKSINDGTLEKNIRKLLELNGS